MGTPAPPPAPLWPQIPQSCSLKNLSLRAGHSTTPALGPSSLRPQPKLQDQAPRFLPQLLSDLGSMCGAE